ncbi:MAG: DNA recombination protein RmuC [Acidimicrobiales bacterium]
MPVALAAVGGVVLGALVAWIVAGRRAESLRDETSTARRDLAVRDAQLVEATASLERERAGHEDGLRNLGVTFESLSKRVLAETVEQFNQTQEQALKERDSKLGLSLKPLETMLADYQRNISEFSVQHAGALSDVKNRATELLEAQQRAHEETRRLNQLLGRGDQRGHWGEIQLANVLEASRLRRNIDYELQVTETTDEGTQRRPDCVVHLPNEARLAIDAKFPFDAFEAAMRAEDPEERRRLYESHAEALRKHVKSLKDRSYWEVVQPAPEFVVCFVPSDFAITAAFDADKDLLADAARDRVVIAGPTNLLSLLWSVAFMLQQNQARVNAEEILHQSHDIVNRIRLVAEPVVRMGRSLDDTVKHYNKMVASIESRLLVSAQRIRRLGGARSIEEVPALDAVNETPSSIRAEKWGLDEENPLPEGVSEILDLDADEE